jgi:DNA mismatch endonuclease, patch repair protein
MTRADTFSPAQRSAIMRAVKSTDTAPERIVRAAVCALGYRRRYRLNCARLPGKPDLAFPSLRKAVFVHGCFWHGHDCRRGARRPKDNAVYWAAKIARNRARDQANRAALRAAGWTALTLWSCELGDSARLARLLSHFLASPRPPS